MQQYADTYLLKTVTAASGTGHNTGTATSFQCGPIGGAIPLLPPYAFMEWTAY